MPLIGPHQLRNPVLLAPMAGITDLPFRRVAWQLGAGYVASEMLGADPRLWHTDKSRLRRERLPGIAPVVVQLAGAEPDMIAAAAVRHWRDGVDIIDINFGCPVKKVCRKAAGSALLRDRPLLARIVAAAVAAVPIPVTVKMRTGWAPDQRDGVEIARLLEAEGVAAITVHGRTRACRFQGAVEYDTMAAIKQAVSVPVFANGDIDSPDRARQVLEHTRADGVMIGRAALGAPWLLGRIAGSLSAEPEFAEKLEIMRAHLADMHEFYGLPRGLRIARKHIGWYLEKLDLPEGLAHRFNRLESADEQIGFLAALTPAHQQDCRSAA